MMQTTVKVRQEPTNGEVLVELQVGDNRDLSSCGSRHNGYPGRSSLVRRSILYSTMDP